MPLRDEGTLVDEAPVNTRIGRGGLGRPSFVLWYALDFLIERAALHDLRALHRKLTASGTKSKVRTMVEDELRRRLPHEIA